MKYLRVPRGSARKARRGGVPSTDEQLRQGALRRFQQELGNIVFDQKFPPSARKGRKQ